MSRNFLWWRSMLSRFWRITFVQCWTNVDDVGPMLYRCPSAVALRLPVKVMVVAGMCVILLELRQSSSKDRNDHYHLKLYKLVQVEGDGATIDCHKSRVPPMFLWQDNQARVRREDPPPRPILTEFWNSKLQVYMEKTLISVWWGVQRTRHKS